MNDEALEYTLWTNPSAGCAETFRNAVVTEADREEMSRLARGIDSDQTDSRLRAFQTPISPETLSRFVK
jgi:hypothetical protein